MTVNHTVVETVNHNGENYLSVQVPYELYSEIDWVEGEILEWVISDDKEIITIRRTRMIQNGHLPDQEPIEG